MSSLTAAVTANLLRHRKRQKISQGTLAHRAKLSVSYVSMLERGKRSPPLTTVEALASALGVEPITLLRS